MKAVRGIALVSLVVAACAQPLGCRRHGDPPPAKPAATATTPSEETSPAPDPRTPIRTLEYLRSLRHQSQYRQLSEHLSGDARDDLVSLLRAVDRLVAASTMLTDRARTAYGPAVADQFRYDSFTNIAGLFSQDVKFISEDIDDDRATVVFQIADRLPLETANLRRNDSHWTLLTEPIGELPDAIFDLAGLFERMARRLVEKKLTADQVHSELALRRSPILRRIESIAAQREDAKEKGTRP